MISTCLDDCTYQVSSPYKVFNLLAVANKSEKNTSGFMGVVHPLGVSRKPPSSHLRNEKYYAKMPEIIFSYLEERIQKSKKFVKRGVLPPPINATPIKLKKEAQNQKTLDITLLVCKLQNRI